jgi:DNA (cytosine-5)-methyltransferase 1
MSRKPRLLDLGCCAGAASTGYVRAGFEVVGVDIQPQPHYPFTFVQADMLTFPLDGFDVYHASPPCQGDSLATLSHRMAGRDYPRLIGPIRVRLESTGKPWVIENVPGAPLRADLDLCGCMFSLELPGRAQLLRRRLIETSWHARQEPVVHDHRLPAISIAGHGTPAWQRRLTGHITVADWRKVMGVGWTTRAELTEAIPPVYAEHVGALLMAVHQARLERGSSTVSLTCS